MNKLFAVALIAGAAQALDVNLFANSLSVTEGEILKLEEGTGARAQDRDNRSIIGPRFGAPVLAQTE